MRRRREGESHVHPLKASGRSPGNRTFGQSAEREMTDRENGNAAVPRLTGL